MTSDARPRSTDRPPHPLARRSVVWLLLGSLVLVQFGYPIAEAGGAWTGIYLLLYSGIIAFSVHTAYTRPRLYWPLAALAVTMVAGGIWFVVLAEDSTAALVAMLAGVGLLQLGLLVLLVHTLLNPPLRANGVDLLLAGLCGFLLIGGVFGAAAALLEIAAPGSFSDPTVAVNPLPWQSLLYGSFVTLGAIGFGDVVAVSSWARSMFSFEGVVGVMFVAVVISQLVSVAGSAKDPDDG
ncbi:ion channel [Demequina sp. SO4-13]|uniref:ion channel n=1 Tax=Demequina sp. SO4-13 TaxID=3401027 RepID=UPI003AF4EE7D